MDDKLFWLDLNPMKFDRYVAKCLRRSDIAGQCAYLLKSQCQSAERSPLAVPLDLSMPIKHETERLIWWLRIYGERLELFDYEISKCGNSLLSRWKALFAIDDEAGGGTCDLWHYGAYCPFKHGIIYPLMQALSLVDRDAVKDMRMLKPEKLDVHMKDFPRNKRLLAAVGSKSQGLGLLYSKALFRSSTFDLLAAITDGYGPVLTMVGNETWRLFRSHTPREILCYICAHAADGCEEEFLKMLDAIIEKIPGSVKEHDLFGWSPLMYLFFRRKNLGYKKSLAELRMPHFEKRLIETGCNPDEKDIFGVSWRMVASEAYAR